jgi:clan AA aspartic protease
MPPESGRVAGSREALVPVRFASGAAAECVVDTGFDGALMLPRPLVESLHLDIVGRLVFRSAGGTLTEADVALAEVEWLGEGRLYEVIVGAGEDSLLGTEMLEGARLTIDYAARSAVIDRTP